VRLLFSEHFKIENAESKEWFDPILHQDTKLFIDPFLVFQTQHSLFQHTYDDIMSFINNAFNLIAESGGREKNVSYLKALSMLRFHEVNEICLGYSSNRQGAGPGPGWSHKLAYNITQCIKNSILHLDHLEEIGLFTIGIGPDSISDITANIMKEKLIKYTQDICTEYDIPMQQVLVKNAKFDKKFMKWFNLRVELPVNPYKQNTGILLVPKEYLCAIPEINSEDFQFTIMHNETLRNDLNFEVDRNLNKEEIVRIALENYDLVKQYIEKVQERNGKAYDLENDPLLRYTWYSKAKEMARHNPLKLNTPTSNEEFLKVVTDISTTFKNFVENKSGYKLLWDEKMTRGKSEEAVQLLFNGIVEQYCIANNIDLTREVNQGRGPVDFRFSSGYRNRVILEIKLARNGKFWNGLEIQLPKYLEIDSARDGIFLVTVYTENDKKKINGIQEKVSEVNKTLNLRINLLVIDAIPHKPSASKL
jgi:hypothetical protein